MQDESKTAGKETESNKVWIYMVRIRTVRLIPNNSIAFRISENCRSAKTTRTLKIEWNISKHWTELCNNCQKWINCQICIQKLSELLKLYQTIKLPKKNKLNWRSFSNLWSLVVYWLDTQSVKILYNQSDMNGNNNVLKYPKTQ